MQINHSKQRGEVMAGVVVALASMIVLAVVMVGWPLYTVWTAEQSGRATLARAEQTRQTLVIQAQAEKDSAILRAQAISIVGEASQKYPEYRQQEFIGAFAEALKEGKIDQIVYVPTEAMIPILEAGKRPSKP